MWRILKIFSVNLNHKYIFDNQGSWFLFQKLLADFHCNFDLFWSFFWRFLKIFSLLLADYVVNLSWYLVFASRLFFFLKLLVDYLMCSVLMKKSFLRNWVCAIHFFALCYIFSLTSHWSFDLIFVLHPPRIVVLHHLILFLRRFLIFTTFANFSCTDKNRADQWLLLSQYVAC